jgi:hypothetical protein
MGMSSWLLFNTSIICALKVATVAFEDSPFWGYIFYHVNQDLSKLKPEATICAKQVIISVTGVKSCSVN